MESNDTLGHKGLRLDAQLPDKDDILAQQEHEMKLTQQAMFAYMFSEPDPEPEPEKEPKAESDEPVVTPAIRARLKGKKLNK